MQTDFRLVEAILADLHGLPGGQQNQRRYRQVRTAPDAASEFDHVVALYENGFVEATDSGDEHSRELVVTDLSPDGKDLLETMRNAALWGQVQRTCAQEGLPLDLKTVKASVANTITGGFAA